MNPIWLIGAPVATSGAVTARNASPGADGVHYIFRESRNGVHDAAAFECDAAVLALGDDDLRTVDVMLAQPAGDIAYVGNAVAHRQPRLGRVDADVVRAADIW